MKFNLIKRIRNLLAVLTISFVPTVFGLSIGDPTPEFSLQDSNGKTHNLSDYKGNLVVLEWVNYECPFVKKHYDTGNMQKLQKEYTGKKVIWLSICSSGKGKQGNFSSSQLAERVRESKSACTAYLIDEDGTVGREYGAKTTPHMFIVNPEGELIYEGAIDSISSYKKSDVENADNYVAKALQATMNGKPIDNPRTKSYGCSVKYAPQK